jgi:hypothetical protein
MKHIKLKLNFFLSLVLLLLFAFKTAGTATPGLVIITGADAQFSDIMLHKQSGGVTEVNWVKGTASFNGNTADITIYDLPSGTYNKIHTKISQLNLHGSHNGLNFTYISTHNLNENINLDWPVTIGDGGYLTLVVQVDVNSIFRDRDGSELDPTDPANSIIIDRNIKTAFKDAFRSK